MKEEKERREAQRKKQITEKREEKREEEKKERRKEKEKKRGERTCVKQRYIKTEINLERFQKLPNQRLLALIDKAKKTKVYKKNVHHQKVKVERSH